MSDGMSGMDGLLRLWERYSGGLIPEPSLEREVFHGDRSQRVTASLLWLRVRVSLRLDLPLPLGTWDPR